MRIFGSIAFFILMVVVLSGNIRGQSLLQNAWINEHQGSYQFAGVENNIEPGDTITPKARLPLRASPPGGLLGLKGKLVGVAQPSTEYKVREEKEINSFVGSQKWMKVQPVYDSANTQEGWIFTGYSTENPDQNVAIISK